ncbi:hypothetical protein G4G28_12580 [Massilia sp. Dwa41.01b]|uniref:hypothetical protein n=1 Tax=unclassified Massilia TaxID=2609279 RepID=UPI001603CB7A|nr:MULTISPECIES: hypothetical protein [unclassified Massilia]QNA89103.1 hypothetical protein G4G28_12580 [Massilia sp. Dwa41.01b]QNA97566.1 hypothetical protein G4G31_16165 [Massilia sp. Se16.2.3]
MTEFDKNDVRRDRVMAARVDAGLHICSEHGLHPALQFLEQVGVPRRVALRVLCSPELYRQRERRKSARPPH